MMTFPIPRYTEEFEGLFAALKETRELLSRNRLELIGTAATKQLKEQGGDSTVMPADLQAERRLVSAACKAWPGLPVLCEEAENSELRSLVSGIELLPYTDDVADLPASYISVDGLDGSAMYANARPQNVGMSIGVIKDGQPAASVVGILFPPHRYATGIPGLPDAVCRGEKPRSDWVQPSQPLNKCLHGVDDNKAVDPRFRALVINRLNASYGTRYPENLPSVAGAIGVLAGQLAFYVTSNARNWDIAGTAALCQAAGQVVCCLDGSPIPWNQARMPPLVFARDDDIFQYVRTQAIEYWD